MDLVLPARHERLFVLRALKSLALADGSLHPEELRMLEVARDLFGLADDLEELDCITPEEVAAGITNPKIRLALIQRMIVLSTLDTEVSEAEVELIERFRVALEVEERTVHNLRQLTQGHIRPMAFDLGRRSFVPKKIKSIWSEAGLRGIWKLAKPLLEIEDPVLAKKFEDLGNLDSGTFGYQLHDHFVSNGFLYPGQAKGSPASMLFHDATHVLAGFDTDPKGELLTAGFQAGYMGEDGLVMFMMIACFFQLGLEPLAKLRGVPAYKGQLNVDTFRDAFVRGKHVNRNLTFWDPWPHMGQSIEIVRDGLNIVPPDFVHRPE